MSALTHVIATIIVISLVYATSRVAENLGLPIIPAVFFWHLSQYLRRKFCRQQSDHEDNHAMPFHAVFAPYLHLFHLLIPFPVHVHSDLVYLFYCYSLSKNQFTQTLP